MIAVFDSNVWISVMHFRNRQSSPVLALERARVFETIAICNEIEEEIERILTERFRWPSGTASSALRFLLQHSIRVRLRGTVHICRDPKDNMILECAQRAHADYIVSDDKDLLGLGKYESIPILTAAEFLARRDQNEFSGK